MSSEPSSSTSSSPALIVLAGATGALGLLIAHQLRRRGATVRALVRPASISNAEAESLRLQGVEIHAVDFGDASALATACTGATCVVSALSGLGPTIVEAQTQLLEAALAAGVPRFIPSDFSADFTRLPEGSNRNFDLRRAFQRRLDAAPIKATSILNGMFMDLLTGQAPLVQPGIHRIVYWGNADQPLDFTTMVDTASFTAAAALDASTPRYLRIAGQVASIRELRAIASQALGHEFRLLRVGSLPFLATLTRLTRALLPAPDDVFPPWQGMQYLHNMLSGQAKLPEPLDNARYPDIRWTPIREVLAGS
ncbi:NmrA family NAD(P)-binding protein [Hymenobacter metallilatus]|uniref:NmrA family protein n=1 Tax=Hymenobacter metallilatus TaxID=2493666 RepID=A0A428JM42_9BACT|nr:NmrA family NAD(P)-binding protein [Hymenobacter metallilatus]RSK34013.1 NmrA family protein [Hymenobacter metallilatus]